MSSILYLILLEVLFAVFEGAMGGEYCVTKTVEYCVWGCCGSYPDTHCCAVKTEAIVGLVMGSLILVVASVASLVVCVYICRQKSVKHRRVLQGPAPWSPDAFFTASSGTAGLGPCPGTAWCGSAVPIQPPPYQTSDPSPAYVHAPAALPPSPPPVYTASPADQLPSVPDDSRPNTNLGSPV